jgi:hypothetical protein
MPAPAAPEKAGRLTAAPEKGADFDFSSMVGMWGRREATRSKTLRVVATATGVVVT